MSQYLVQVAYTAEAWAAQLNNPQDRTKLLQPVIERLGGSFGPTYFAFGEYDIVTIVEMPDNINAAAFSLMASAGGAVKAIKTTPLMTIDEGIQSMRKAADALTLYPSPVRQAANV